MNGEDKMPSYDPNYDQSNIFAKISVNLFGADGVTLQQFSEPAGGQVVFHLHVHVIPRKNGIALKPPASVKETPEVLKDQAAKLAAALG